MIAVLAFVIANELQLNNLYIALELGELFLRSDVFGFSVISTTSFKQKSSIMVKRGRFKGYYCVKRLGK